MRELNNNMGKAEIEKYIGLLNELEEVRRRIAERDFEASAWLEEDRVLDKMDAIWYNLSRNDRKRLKEQVKV